MQYCGADQNCNKANNFLYRVDNNWSVFDLLYDPMEGCQSERNGARAR